MDLSSLKPACGSTHHEKRIGRGQGSGKGGTSTRGHKGAKSRSGYHTKIGFEGGQMPLQTAHFLGACPTHRPSYRSERNIDTKDI